MIAAEGVPDVDLDWAEEPPARQRHPLPALVVLAALLAMLVAAAARTALDEPQAASAQSSNLTITAEVGRVILAPEPTAVLLVTMTNRSQSDIATGTITVLVDNLMVATADTPQLLTPGLVDVVEVPVRLNCPGPVSTASPPVVSVLAYRPRAAPDSAEAESRTVPVSLVGGLAERGGLCAAADRELPGGWRSPMPARVAGMSAEALSVAVDDLEGGKSSVLIARAGEWPVPVTVRPGSDGPNSVLIDVARPYYELCEDGDVPAGPVPTSLELILSLDAAGQGERARLAIVGPQLADWLLQFVRESCTS